jgi:hypothetical protein
MTFLSGQDDFFQTANQPISVRHLCQPYNKRSSNIWSEVTELYLYRKAARAKAAKTFVLYFEILTSAFSGSKAG